MIECISCGSEVEETTLPLLCDPCLRESAQRHAERLDVIEAREPGPERRTRA